MRKYKVRIWAFVAIILLISFAVDSYKNSTKIIPENQTQIFSYVDKAYEEAFNLITDGEIFVKDYNVNYSDDFEKANIILTSDLDKINLEEEFETIACSPLIFAMKKSNDLNNYRIANTKYGWLISVSRILNNEEDIITCDFKRVFDTVISGGNWSDLGGPDEEIKIYCPNLKTKDGQIFKEFLVRILNEGSNKSNKEIDSQINKFFSSSNVIQTDVISKLEKLNNNIPENELYIALESDFLVYTYEFETQNDNLDLSFIYPETCVVKEIYLQYNEVEEEVKEQLNSPHFHYAQLEGHTGFSDYFHIYDNKFAFRNKEKDTDFTSGRISKYNFQEGINTFNMKYE